MVGLMHLDIKEISNNHITKNKRIPEINQSDRLKRII